MSHRWSAVEDEQLHQLAGDIPWPKVLHAYNIWASLNGYPGRTEIGLRQRCETLRISRICEGQYLSTGTIRSLTGAGWRTIQRWVQQGHLTVIRSGRKWYIPRAALRQFAQQHPAYFSRLPVSNLTQLLDDERLAEQLTSEPQGPAPGFPRPVRCVTTGERFPSAAAAGRRFHLSRSAIYLAVAGKRAVAGGLRFEAL